MQQTVALLEKRIAMLEARENGDAPSTLVLSNIDRLQDEIIRITKEMSPGQVSIGTMTDPEYPGDTIRFVRAETSAAPKETVDLRIEWHRRIRKLDRSLDLALRLSVSP